MVLGEAIGANISNIKIDSNSTITGNDQINDIGGCVLVNSHYGLANQAAVYKKGKLKVDNKMFDSCVRCEGGDSDKQAMDKKVSENENND